MISKPKKNRKRESLKFKEKIAWIFGTPAILFQFFFGWFPIALAFIVAFQKFYLFKPCEYIGWTNFSYIFTYPLFYTSIKNTFYYAGLAIALTFLLPIIIAILLMEMRKSVIRVMMILWFIPVASMAGIIIWKWFYNVQYGLFNGILASLGFPTIGWLDDPRLAMLCLVLPGLIMYGPGLIYIATLQSIPDCFYEAAELEGASFWQKVWHITLPRLRPIIAVMLILAVIGNLQVFDQPFIMTGGGPGFATTTMVLVLWRLAFEQMRYGEGTAVGVILFFIIMILVIIQRKYFKENIDV